MNDKRYMLSSRHSYHTTSESESSSRVSAKVAKSETYTKSEENTPTSRSDTWSTSKTTSPGCAPRLSDADYYKKYEHDEVPVKDCELAPRLHPGRGSLTDSALDKLERRVFASISRELQTDDSSIAALESNVKFFKSTVERIFDNFYESMQDFDAYKQRFQRILERSREGYLDDMENFVRDMFEHIAAGERARRSDADDASGCGDSPRACDDADLAESYKHEHYLSESTLHATGPKSQIDEILNVVLFGERPRVHASLNECGLTRQEARRATGAASADNLSVLAAKRAQLDAYAAHAHEGDAPDRDIPVKVSSAKKNIHTDEDFARTADSTDSFRSFLSKLCNVLCRRFRRTS